MSTEAPDVPSLSTLARWFEETSATLSHRTRMFRLAAILGAIYAVVSLVGIGLALSESGSATNNGEVTKCIATYASRWQVSVGATVVHAVDRTPLTTSEREVLGKAIADIGNLENLCGVTPEEPE